MADDEELLSLTTGIVASFVQGNPIGADQLPAVIDTVHRTLRLLQNPPPQFEAPILPSAAQIRRSIRKDALISFIDGNPYKTLKRHLTVSGFTPDEYRARFGLPRDYPMVAPSYSELRSTLAKEMGLGSERRPSKAVAAQGR